MISLLLLVDILGISLLLLVDILGISLLLLVLISGNRTHDLRNGSTVTLPTELRGRTEKVGDDLGGESRRRESKGTYEC